MKYLLVGLMSLVVRVAACGDEDDDDEVSDDEPIGGEFDVDILKCFSSSPCRVTRC
jgi:hypothetical protein